MNKINWNGLSNLVSRSYDCGYCGNSIASQIGYWGNYFSDKEVTIYICHKCYKPTSFILGEQIPGASFGRKVSHINDQFIEMLYEEARVCCAANAYTAAVMLCRKLLMNIAIKEGAKPNLSYTAYVDYLNDNNYIPPNGRGWVDAIRKMGNEANHKVEFKSDEDARLILTFTEMLLKFIYEMPGLLGGHS